MLRARLFFIALFISASLFSQNEHTAQPPKVGLVLSGGGAKGFAHIAVLKYFEEIGLQVDYVGGTSMGAVIGGLYASGYNADEIKKIIRETDYQILIRDLYPRSSKPFYKKEYGENYFLTFPFKNFKIKLPRSISNGQNLLNKLTALTLPVSHIKDFSKLPIPFFCVATNVETGGKKVFDSGSLPISLLASSVLPNIIEPVTIEGNSYIDGGIVDNFPVDEMKKKGVDIIIGVDIQQSLSNEESIDSGLQLIYQIVNFREHAHLEEKYKETDILIKPDLHNFSALDFSKIDTILEASYQAAKSHEVSLKKIVDQQKKKRKEIKISAIEKIKIGTIDESSMRPYTRSYILGKLKLKNKDEVSIEKLHQKIINLSATGNFDVIQYEIEKEEQELYNLKLIGTLDSDNRTTLNLGLHYDETYNSAMLMNVTHKNLLFKNDLTSLDIILGDKLRYNFNFFIDNGFYWSTGLRSRYNTFESIFFYEPAKYEDFTNQLYFQTVFNRRFALGLGFEHKHIKAYKEDIVIEETPTGQVGKNERIYLEDTHFLNFISYLKLDSYDHKYFPTKGVLIDVDFRWFLTSSSKNSNFVSFSLLQAKIGTARSITNRLSTQYSLEAGFKIGFHENPLISDFFLGGYGYQFINNFVPLYGYKLGELHNNSYLKGTFTARYTTWAKHHIAFTANFAKVEDDIFNKGDVLKGTKAGLLVGYGIDSFLGPLEFHYSWSPNTGNQGWHISIGHWF